MGAAAFRVRCIRPLSNSRSAGADQIVRHLLGRRSPVGEAEFVFMAYYAKTDIPYR